ncbi:MAG: hypothetical protein VX685_07100, partial [Actinomycetota bacterium]|nr:hypothetical protein [Actinomycetota bacterium]
SEEDPVRELDPGAKSPLVGVPAGTKAQDAQLPLALDRGKRLVKENHARDLMTLVATMSKAGKRFGNCCEPGDVKLNRFS